MADKSLAIEDDVLDKWLNSLDIAAVKESFSKQGYLKIEEIISEQCVKRYSSLYDKLLSGDIDTSVHRHDLGSHGNYISKISIIFSTLMILLP
ncbi:hypothetical protein EB796_009456 [Bugula neritina]|uniref:Uncharacterized protein n=1 Tax=Bugula neritina TaxID=10212 RepID=A0A7J7K210_BUGNE|nr:hypothetical protein EB796_009456 [Bugula neritina]